MMVNSCRESTAKTMKNLSQRCNWLRVTSRRECLPLCLGSSSCRVKVEHKVEVCQQVLSEGIVLQGSSLGIRTWRRKDVTDRLADVEDLLGADPVHASSEGLVGKVIHGLDSFASTLLGDQVIGTLFESIVCAAGDVQQFVWKGSSRGFIKVEEFGVVQSRVQDSLSLIYGCKDIIDTLGVICLLGQDLLIDAWRVFQEGCKKADTDG